MLVGPLIDIRRICLYGSHLERKDNLLKRPDGISDSSDITDRFLDSRGLVE
jgi:hypothetical protein